MVQITEGVAQGLAEAPGSLVQSLLALLKTSLLPFLAWLMANPTGEADFQALVAAALAHDWTAAYQAEQKLVQDWKASHP